LQWEEYEFQDLLFENGVDECFCGWWVHRPQVHILYVLILFFL